MSFDEEKQQIVMSDLGKQKEGFHKITFNLSDSLGAAKSYTFNVILNRPVKEETVEILVQEDTLEKVVVANTSYPTAKIDSISVQGILEIKFSSKMKTEFINATEINSTILDLYIDPSRSRTNDNDTAKLNFQN